MMRFAPRPRCTIRLNLSAALVFAALALPARAQGTDEQREACTPDAIKLCQDTIPDIPKTTACMKAHEAELSPRCRAVFSDTVTNPQTSDEPDATPAPRPRKRHIARDTPYPEDGGPPVERRYRYRSPDTGEEVEDDDIDRARAEIARLCEAEMIGPRTCAITERALVGAR